MKYCQKCKSKYSDSLNFCTKCGTELVSEHRSGVRKINLKRIYKILAVSCVLIVVAIFSFFYTRENAATYLYLDPNDSVVVCKKGEELNVDIHYDGYVWQLEELPKWSKLKVQGDNSFTITVKPNYTGKDREGIVLVSSGKLFAQMTIKQNGLAKRLKVDKSSLKFPEEGGDEVIYMETDDMDIKYEAPDFVDVRIDNDRIKISAPKNYEYYRSGKITIKADNLSTRISVTQSGECGACSGTGKESCSHCWGQGGFQSGMLWFSCQFCSGGKVRCYTCGGDGKRE